MKNLLFILSLFSMLLSSSLSTAQTDNQETPFIEVIGKASQEVAPDRIFISVNLAEKTIGKKRLTIAQQETNLFEILNRLNIDESKVVLTEALSEIIKKRQRDRGTSYNKTYMIELSSAQEVSSLFEQLSVNGIREATIERTDHSDIINIRKQVRIEAIKAAKAKAIYLAEAIGHSLGAPMVIREQQTNDFARGLNSSNTALSSITRNMIMGYDMITVSFAYYLKYEIN